MTRKSVLASANVSQEGQRTGPAFVSYVRVSTAKQGRSGLGLEAQQEAVARHVASAGGVVVAEFVETESGKRKDRPQLAAALAACRAMRATLVVAKLDRLARNVAFISALMESGTEFVAADMPMVNRLTAHILAAVAEEEARMISARTKAALAQAKARGTVLGNPRLKPGTAEQARQAAAVRAQQADRKAADLLPIIREIQGAGLTSLKGIAGALNARGVPTTGGKGAWTHRSVARVLERAAA